MTMKSVPIAVGFASITVTQLALGICMITFAAIGGGKLKHFCWESSSHSERLLALFRLRLCS